MACKTPEHVTTDSNEPAHHWLIYFDNVNIFKLHFIWKFGFDNEGK